MAIGMDDGGRGALVIEELLLLHFVFYCIHLSKSLDLNQSQGVND